VSEERQESAERLVRNAEHSENSRNIAAHILRLGRPEYFGAFMSYLRGGVAAVMLNDEHRAALNEGTGTQGGFLVPPMLDPTIILTNNGATNPFRSIATVKSIQTQTWKGVTSAGVTAEWTAEATEVADASPTFSQPGITPIRADAYIQASRETLQDTDIGNEVAMLFADARDRLEATAFAVGTGSTQPKGVVTAVAAVTASRVAGTSGSAGAADFVVKDVYGLANALPPRYRPNSSWLAEQTTYNAIRQFASGSGPTHAFWADLAADRPPLLLGRPAYESSEMDNTIVSGSNDDVLLIGDFSKYYVVDRIGAEVLFEPLVKGANRRPTGEVGWVMFWRVGGDAVDTNAFRLLRL
jgi:HK97 family phage major capsid protein